MEWIASEIFSIFFSSSVGGLKGLSGKLKLHCVKKKLVKNLSCRIQKQYGDRVFYNELDRFLSANKVIINLLENCESTPHTVYKSRSQVSDYYIQMFIERFPCYTHYRSEITNLIQDCFDVVYNTLNDFSGNETARVICNLAKELSGEISFSVDEINHEVKSMSKNLEILLQQNKNELSESTILLEPYLEAQSRLYLDRIGSDFIPRTIYYKNEDGVPADSLDALIENKHILLLGEAGYGKTFESISLLSKICKSPKANDLIPVYLPLYEYGTLYDTISEGIKYKLTPFCNGNSDHIINTWLISGQIVLILDGIDDIQKPETRIRFFAEAKNYIINYEKSLIFMTARVNRYHGELGNIKEYFLKGLSREIINETLHEEGIYTTIPDSYYWLFSNPMFLSVGVAVLKQNDNRKIFNRSILFEELLLMLCGEWDKKKGILSEQTYTYDDILNVLGKYAFDNFGLPPQSLLEFDQFMGKLLKGENKAQFTNTIIRSGVLKIEGKISFAHKLFQEYCTAYFIIKNFPISGNESFYCDFICREEWKEVFIFVSGMLKSVDEQDRYLNYIMEHNLALYVECINAKSDLSALLPDYQSTDYVERYLRSILKTYTFIIDRYFAPLKDSFDPKPGKEEANLAEKKIRIVGCVSDNGKHLHYWLDRAAADEPEAVCLQETQISEYYKHYESQAIKERKEIKSFFVNLELSGLGGDSGRKVAIDRIKDEIKTILEKRRLIESQYLLAERLTHCRKKIKELRDLNDLDHMYLTVDQMIASAEESATNLVAYDYNGIELYYLRLLLKVMIKASVKYDDCLLPETDVTLTASSGWVWDLYSDKQKINRITKFFYFHQLSYMEMIQANFPLLYHNFSRYLDAPYQTVVLLYLKTDRSKDVHSEPSILYYTIASPSESIVLPQIRIFDNEQEFIDYHKEIYNEIRQSYFSKGREAHRLGYTHTGFTHVTTSHRYSYDSPLSDYVYKSIETSIEEVLGDL